MQAELLVNQDSRIDFVHTNRCCVQFFCDAFASFQRIAGHQSQLEDDGLMHETYPEIVLVIENECAVCGADVTVRFQATEKGARL